MRRFSRSEMWTFKRCRRRWYLGTYRQLRRRGRKPGPASLGSRVHEALAAYYQGGDPVEVLQLIRDDDFRRWQEHEQLRAEKVELPSGVTLDVSEDAEAWKEWEKEHELATIMVEGYLDWLEETGADAHLEVISAEEELEVPVPGLDKVSLVGKLDTRAIDHEREAKVFMDHKTTGSFSGLEQALKLNEQLLHYHLLEVMKDGPEDHTQGGLFNMLRRVKRTANAKPPFYARVSVWHNLGELRSYFLRVLGTIQEMLQVTAKLDDGADPRQVAYPTPEGSCSWQCPFYAVCPMLDDPMMDAEGFLSMAYELHDPMERYVAIDREET